ncbi:MAG: NADH-quinone oxidoreductase subunit C [Fulvivirga sp.]
MTFDQIKDKIASKFPGAITAIDENATPKALMVAADKLSEVCAFLYKDEDLYFDMLSCLTGIDNGEEANTMEVAYNLSSIPFEHAIMLKVELPRAKPVIPSVAEIWKTANWHEREAFDLLGIQFEGHPDLRRILLPTDWEGHPLRKDYQHQDKYRGIKVEY